MRWVLRALWDGFRLRCPRCHTGRMFAAGFTMLLACPVCELPFERSSGEITGGMGINSGCTLLIVSLFAFLGFLPQVPFLLLFGAMFLFAIGFPIAFYRSSRGIWAAILYLTGDNDEPD